MPIQKPEGLKALTGLNDLDQYAKAKFFHDNENLLGKYKNDPDKYNKAGEVLYNNRKFIDRYGKEVFDRYNNGTPASYEMRNSILKSDVINNTFKDTFGKHGDFDSTLQYLSDDSKLKLMESDYLNDEEIDENNINADAAAFSLDGPNILTKWLTNNVNEARKEYLTEKNKSILDKIVTEDLDKKCNDNRIKEAENEAYFNEDVVGKTEEETKQKFITEIDPTSYKGNMGIPDLCSRYGDGTDVDDTLQNLTIDDMRHFLARKYIYERALPPALAQKAINNDADRYIRKNQDFFDKTEALANDIMVSVGSYTADKADGIYSLGLLAADDVTVYMDSNGIVDTTKHKIMRNETTLDEGYLDENLNFVVCHPETVSRYDLHQTGKNVDGSDDVNGLWKYLNPVYRTKAEQWGTWNEDEIKRADEIGSSRHNVIWEPGSDSNLIYESGKMSSFLLADGLSYVAPWGMGILGKGVETLGKGSKIVLNVGKGIRLGSKYLSVETKFGQAYNGTLGAIGIGDAYARGAFNEKYAENQYKVAQMYQNKAINEVNSRYENDTAFKDIVDKRINEKIDMLGEEYAKQNQINSKAEYDKVKTALAEQARIETFTELYQNRLNDFKSSKEYADAQAQAINEAGNSSLRTFLPEAVKYSLVNNLGYRKWMYSNPNGFKAKLSQNLKGLKEVTTSAGKQRLAVEPTFTTFGSKMAKLGKIAGSQAWGGAWTNGTDDMMVDAAERWSDDSFNAYLDAVASGESTADTYGFLMGLDSYTRGLFSSLGQSSTWNAAAVGASGSIFSFGPNFINIASLATEEGRQQYKKQYLEKPIYRTDESGYRSTQATEEGNTTVPISLRENFRDRASFFIQNGILSEYYGAKMNEKQLQEQADYVNNFLDQADDFKNIEDLLSGNNVIDNADNLETYKEARFLNSLNLLNTINNLGNSSEDPFTMSSVVRNMKDKIDRFTNGEIKDTEKAVILDQYYKQHPGLAQSEKEDNKALQMIRQNARELQAAEKIYTEMSEKIADYEETKGIQLDNEVRKRLVLNRAMNVYWSNRIKEIKGELNLYSNAETSAEDLFSVLGSAENCMSYVQVCTQQQEEIDEEISKQQKKIDDIKKDITNQEEELRLFEDGEKKIEAQKKLKLTKSSLKDAELQLKHLNQMSLITEQKKNQVEEAIKLKSFDGIENDQKIIANESVILADDILNTLSNTHKAFMLDEHNANLYSKEQLLEISKAKAKLISKDANALEKLAKLAEMENAVKSSDMSYDVILSNPEAAAYRNSIERSVAASNAYELINKNNAELLADMVNDTVNALKSQDGIDDEILQNGIYKTIRRYGNLLPALKKYNMLPEYKHLIKKAEDWNDFCKDIANAVKALSLKGNDEEILSDVIDDIIDNALTKTDAMTALEEAVSTHEDHAENLEKILSALQSVGYIRNNQVIEDRKKKEEQKKKKAEEDAKRIAEEEARKKREEELKKTKPVSESSKEEDDNIDWGKAKPVDGLKDVNLFDEEESSESEEKSNETTEKDDSESSEKQSKEEASKSEVSSTETETNLTVDKEGNITGNSYNFEVSDNTVAEGKEDDLDSNSTDLISFKNENGVTFLNANSMCPYDSKALESGKITVVGKKGDTRNNYYDWMENAGIQLQNIIDYELADILKANPKAKVRFLSVNPINNATHDEAMKNRYLLCLEYNDSVNRDIVKIHSKFNHGGVITVADGKQYLIIGCAGFRAQNGAQRNLYYTLFGENANDQGLISKAGKKYFREHGNERFYVHPSITTEVQAESLIPGYIITSEPGISYDDHHRLSDYDESGNLKAVPDGKLPKNLKFMISTGTGVYTTNGIDVSQIMRPHTKGEESQHKGFVYLLIPATNGKYSTARINTTTYDKIDKSSALFKNTQALLMQLTNKNPIDQKTALERLCSLYILNSSTSNILISPDGKVVTFTNGAKGVGNKKVFNLDNFDRQEFLDAFTFINPIVKINTNVLNDYNALSGLNEAGALRLNLTRLHQLGASYSIVGINPDGSMAENTPVIYREGTSVKRDVSQIIYNGDYYRYEKESDKFYLGNSEITNKETIKQLRYSLEINERNLLPYKEDRNFNYYVLSDSLIVKRNKKTNIVTEYKNTESKIIIEQNSEDSEVTKRNQWAQESIENGTAVIGTEINLTEDSKSVNILPDTTANAEPQAESNNPVVEDSSYSSSEDSSSKSSTEVSAAGLGHNNAQSFAEILKDPKKKKKIIPELNKIYNDLRTCRSTEDLISALQSKGVSLDNIDTSDAGIEAWLQNIRCHK